MLYLTIYLLYNSYLCIQQNQLQSKYQLIHRKIVSNICLFRLRFFYVFFLINIHPVFSGYQMPLYLHLETSNELGCLKEAVMSQLQNELFLVQNHFHQVHFANYYLIQILQLLIPNLPEKGPLSHLNLKMFHVPFEAGKEPHLKHQSQLHSFSLQASVPKPF